MVLASETAFYSLLYVTVRVYDDCIYPEWLNAELPKAVFSDIKLSGLTLPYRFDLGSRFDIEDFPETDIFLHFQYLWEGHSIHVEIELRIC